MNESLSEKKQTAAALMMNDVSCSKMASGLLEPPGGGEPLCVFLLGAEGEDEEESRREVGCQWESPEEQRREVGCQSDAAERRDAAVQVDLLTQQLGWRHTGESHR